VAEDLRAEVVEATADGASAIFAQLSLGLAVVDSIPVVVPIRDHFAEDTVVRHLLANCDENRA
jgi:hypothetical protein